MTELVFYDLCGKYPNHAWSPNTWLTRSVRPTSRYHNPANILPTASPSTSKASNTVPNGSNSPTSNPSAKRSVPHPQDSNTTVKHHTIPFQSSTTPPPKPSSPTRSTSSTTSTKPTPPHHRSSPHAPEPSTQSSKPLSSKR